ncbi:MAG TPA: alpha/beta hydrolase family protein [Bryobacteraceae bacterium]|nr:alpha/beta hydrolase family protein [Bryobacteraceae bacterium]
MSTSASAALGWTLTPSSVAGGVRPRSYEDEMPDMLVSHLSRKLNGLASRWDAERSRIKTPDQVQERNRFVREKFRAMVHGFPERVPLDPVVVRSVEGDGYRVENVMFQSRPNFWVTGNLYVPASGKGPFPGIISPCGHYQLARMEPEYQFAYMNLVRGGFVVLAYDPVGQGERRQYWDPQTNETEIGGANSPVFEHSMPGQVLLLLGEDLTHYRIWDGMRAIDYLLTRPEVDKERIGCAGHSGGSTLTIFISSLDDRVRCAVVNQSGTGHRWPLHYGPGSAIGPSDIEQNLFPAAVHGIDTCDLVTSIAPRPLLWTIEIDSESFRQTVEHIRARYEQLGVTAKFATDEANDPHSWTMKIRQATTDWFSRWFYSRPGPGREPDFEAARPGQLYCTANGSLRYAQQGDSIFSLILKKGASAPGPRKNGTTPKEIADLIRFRNNHGPLDVRHIMTTPRKGYQVEKLEFLSEPGIYIPAWVFVPEKRNADPVTVFVHEAGKEAEGLEFGRLERLARKGHLIVAVDVRGVGQTAPPHPGGEREGPFGHLFDIETALAYMAWYMDESLFGMRVGDVIRSVDYALGRPDRGAAGVRVHGKGAGALWCLYAAALDPRIGTVIAQNGLATYASLTRVDRYTHTAGIFIPDVLKHFDLPQIAAAVADRTLVLVSPVDPMQRPLDVTEARAAYALAEQAYRTAGAADRLRIVDTLSL